MALLADRLNGMYAGSIVPRPPTGDGPWREAIAFWLARRNANQAELARATGLRPNTISLAVRGHHVNTQTLKTIADALQVPLEEVLVHPRYWKAQEDLHQIALRSVELALNHRVGDRPATPTSETADSGPIGLKQLPPRAPRSRRQLPTDAAAIVERTARNFERIQSATKRTDSRQRNPKSRKAKLR